MINLLFAQYGNVSDIEIIWTTLALAGLIFSIFNVREALQDKRALAMAGIKNGRKMIATYAVRAESARATIQAIFLAIGLLAMTYPDPPDSFTDRPWNLALISIVFRWGLIISAGLICLKSYWAYNLRRVLRENMLAEYAPPGEISSTVEGQLTVTTEEDGSTSSTIQLEGKSNGEK